MYLHGHRTAFSAGGASASEGEFDFEGASASEIDFDFAALPFFFQL